MTCDKQLNCGHYCNGSVNDDLCIPCLKVECVEKLPQLTLGKNEDDWCDICVSAGLGMMPCIQLSCKHVFHEDCILKIL